MHPSKAGGLEQQGLDEEERWREAGCPTADDWARMKAGIPQPIGDAGERIMDAFEPLFRGDKR